jgi:hypothetical protein
MKKKSGRMNEGEGREKQEAVGSPETSVDLCFNSALCPQEDTPNNDNHKNPRQENNLVL